MQGGWAPAEALYTRLTHQESGWDQHLGSSTWAQPSEFQPPPELPHLAKSAHAAGRRQPEPHTYANALGSTPSPVSLPYLPAATATADTRSSSARERGLASGVVPSGADDGGLVELWCALCPLEL